MSKPSFIKIIIIGGIIPVILGFTVRFWPEFEPMDAEALPSGKSEVYRSAVRVPAGTYLLGSREPGCYPVRSVALPGYLVWPYEVPRSWWREFRMHIDPGIGGDFPVTSVSYAEAQEFCRWFSERYDVVARLPTTDEWEAAARAGKGGITFPWGWYGPEGRAVFKADAPSSVTSLSPNQWGLYHMSGNVAEWCMKGDGETQAPVMGGSWAERDEKYLRISHRLLMPAEYRDEDVGFRIVIEEPQPKEAIALTTSIRE